MLITRRQIMYKRSKKILVTGLTTALLLTSMAIPAAAAEDFGGISISARVEEYIAESKSEDPVTELVGTAAPMTPAVTTEKALTASNKGVVASKVAAEETPKQEEVKEAEETKEEVVETPVKYPQFKDRVIVTVDDGVLNIRESASPDAEIVGTIDRAGIALVEEKGDGWTKIGSGNCEGYVKNDFIKFGDEAGAWAEENGIPKYIKVQGSGLRVRKEASTDSDILDAVYENETYSVLGEEDDWVEIEMYDGTVGFVNTDYVEVRFETPRAKTMEEIEEMRRAEEEDARREKERQEAEAKAAAEEAERKAAEAERSASTNTEKEEEESNSSNASESSGSSAAERSAERIERTEEIKKENEKSIEASKEESTPVVASTHAELRADMIAYAKQFLGNPYVYGGTSLTNGTDCSGFTMRIYEHFGYKIPRAGGQRTFGKLISVSEAQPGDLVFYDGHVTMYIGGGKVIHASSERTGIIISSLSYSGTPLFARNIIDAY